MKKGQSWIIIIPTVNQMLVHNWEIFAMNNGNSSSKWPENPVESWNKYECAF